MLRLAPLAVLLFPAVAAAGPMSWTYQARVEPTPSPSFRTSQHFALTNTDPKEPGGFARLPVGSDGAADGAATITLASASRGSFVTDLPPGAGAADGFRMLLEITDGASGLRGYTQFDGRGWLLTAGAGGEVELEAGGRVLMSLGRHRYDITLRDGSSLETARVVADVSVTELGTVAAPEPASFVLAGLGLAGVTGRRLVRRRSALQPAGG